MTTVPIVNPRPSGIDLPRLAVLLLLGLWPVLGQEEETGWETTGALGFTITRGNSETVVANVSLLGLKKWELNELSAGISGGYGESEGIRNNENLRGTLQYNRLREENESYLFGKMDILHDSIADIDYRISISAGYGYYLVNRERFALSLDLGPGFIAEQTPIQRDEYMTLKLGEKLDWKIGEGSRLWQSIECLPEISRPDNFLIVLEIGVESALTEKLGLRVTLEDRFDNHPAPGRRSNDLRLITGLSYKF